MANLITTAITYTKEDANAFFLTPLFIQEDAFGLFDVMPNLKSSQKLQRYSSLQKVTKAESSGFAGTTGVTLDQRTITIVRAEAEIEQDAETFFGTIEGERLRSGTMKSDLDGTELKNIISGIYLKAIDADLQRQIWLNDTASLDANYNFYDGIFKKLAALPAAQKKVFPAGAIAVDGAIAQFEIVKAAASNELLAERANTVILVSRSVADNYRESLRDGGTEAAFANLQSGTPTLSWDGFPIIEMAQWDTSIAGDSLALAVHRIVMTTRQNLVIGTDFGQGGGADFWYNKDLKVNRFRFEYVIGVEYKNDELTVTNIAV